MKTYDKLSDMLKDGLFSLTDNVVIWGKRGSGKSSLAGKLMSEFMKPRQAKRDIQVSQIMCDKLAEAGYRLKPYEDHLVFCDTYFENGKTSAYYFKSTDFGLPNDQGHSVNILIPGSRLFWDEAQDLFDSHNAAPPTFVSKGFELGRQIEIFTCMAMQRPMRLHKDIRELSIFIEVVELKNKYNKYGRLVKTTWTCNIIYNNTDLESYLNTHDKRLIDRTVKIEYIGNIFKCYDTHYFMPLFYKGFENTIPVYEKTTRTEFTEEGFKEFQKKHSIDIPETYKTQGDKQSGNRKKTA